jgi:hypothetical protein
MERWIRPLAACVVLTVLAAACSLAEGDAAPESTTSTQATTTSQVTTTVVETTTTTLPVVPVNQPGTFFVTDHGAMADGKNDDSPAFQAAVDAAAVDGGVVVVPSVSGRRAYVLNRTVDVPTGVSIVGAVAGVDAGGPYPWPEVELTGVKILARPSPPTQPLFNLGAGTSVEGLWITYDQQPLPSDADFQDEDLAFGYRTFDAVREFFVEEHVTPMGPVFYVESGDQVRIANIVADRYYDFLYMKGGGPLTVDGVSLYGFAKGFTIESSDARNVFTNVSFAPSVGPFVPGSEPGNPARTWVFGAIASFRNNVGFHFGAVNGFVLDNVSFEAGNTAIRMGASFDDPIIDPVTEQFVTQFPSEGPWGQIEDLRVERAAVGLHLVWPSPVPTQMSNVSMSTGIDDGAAFTAVGGSGSLTGIARQAFVLVEPSYNLENNGLGGQVPVVQAVNVSVTGSADIELLGEAAGSVDVTNGRVFLIDGDLGMEINGFSLGLPYDDSFMIAVGGASSEAVVRMRGVLSRGRPEADKIANRDGVEVLTGDVVIVEVPVTVPVPASTTTTSAAPTTTATP